MKVTGDKKHAGAGDTACALREIKRRVRFIADAKGVKQRDVWAELVAPVVKAEFEKCNREDAKRGA
jgi:hypothetical protein